MPWCPVCKNEYKDGYTLCADCGAELVAFLKDENEKPSNVVIEENFEIDSANINIPEDVSVPVDEEIIKKNSRDERVKPFVKAQERAENYKSSAFALLFVGFIGAIFLVLAYFNIIPVNLAPNINAIFYVVMGFIFLAFIVIGFKTISAAKMIADTVEDENELTARIYAFFKDNYSMESIDKIAFSDEAQTLSMEELFFPRSKCIKEIIVTNFGELDDAYLTELTETVYTDIFES